MEQRTLADELRGIVETHQQTQQEAEEIARQKRDSEIEESRIRYIAAHKPGLISALTESATAVAAAGKTKTSIERKVGPYAVTFFKMALNEVGAHFEEKGFQTRIFSADNGSTRWRGDLEEYIEPTQYTVGLEISWGARSQE